MLGLEKKKRQEINNMVAILEQIDLPDIILLTRDANTLLLRQQEQCRDAEKKKKRWIRKTKRGDRMPKLKLSDRERQNRTLIAIIQSGKVMEGVSVEKLSKLTGIPKSTLYQRFSVPEDIRLGELREILKVLKIPEEEKERIGREVI